MKSPLAFARPPEDPYFRTNLVLDISPWKNKVDKSGSWFRAFIDVAVDELTVSDNLNNTKTSYEEGLVFKTLLAQETSYKTVLVTGIQSISWHRAFEP